MYIEKEGIIPITMQKIDRFKQSTLHTSKLCAIQFFVYICRMMIIREQHLRICCTSSFNFISVKSSPMHKTKCVNNSIINSLAMNICYSLKVNYSWFLFGKYLTC